MPILRLLNESSPEARRHWLMVTGLAGLANAVVMALLNNAAEAAAQKELPDGRALFLFILAVSTFQVANKASFSEATRIMQERLQELRETMVDRVCRADLRTLERLGPGHIYNVTAHSTDVLSKQLPVLVMAAQNIAVVIGTLLYIAWLSQTAFVVLTFFAALGVLLFTQRRQRLSNDMVAVYGHEAAVLDGLAHYADGFQEIRLNADKNDGLHRHFVGIVQNLQKSLTAIGRDWATVVLFSQAYFYALLGLVVFVMPIFFEGYSDTIYKLASAAIFCMAPVTGLTGTASLYSKANVELGHLFGLMDSLEKGATETTTAEAASAFASFQTIALEGITFRYEKGGFATGPWDLRLRRGELLYLRGGNGAGKSTALKVICGLYRPESGTVRVDGQPVTDASLQSYRELFSAIFTDFHLFERLYGLENVSPDRVQELLHRMQLASKVTFQDGRFSTLDLSTGQRKRLAMIVSLLEDRPIFIFDEWAADQDAHFREHFYTELVPELLLRGKTVLIVSHDDRYWRPEDRVVTVDLGALHESVSRPS